MTIPDDQRLESQRSEITGITAWKVELPLNEGTFSWSGGVLHDAAVAESHAEVEASAGEIGYLSRSVCNRTGGVLRKQDD